MYFIPGAHRGPLRKLNHRLPDGTLHTDVLSDEPFPEHRKVAAEVSAGSLVVFDGRAPHLSGENRSGKSRHAYSLHAIDRRCHYPADNWLQRSADLPLRGFV
jgi:phytanoyl-CoA hydroxylase